MEKTTFGQRLRLAFKNAKNAEIARKIGVGETAVTNYMAGRVPDIEKLKKIKSSTECDLDWLLTGDEPQNVTLPDLNPALIDRLQSIAHEQSRIIFSDVDIAGSNTEAVTLRLLIEYLLYRAMVSVNLIESGDLMSAADRKLAERFSFVANIPQSVDDRIGEIVERKLTKERFTLDTAGEVRDMIRDIVKEELAASASRKHLVLPIKVGEKNTGARKAG